MRARERGKLCCWCLRWDPGTHSVLAPTAVFPDLVKQQVSMPSQSTAGEITAELKKDNTIVDANNIENKIDEGKRTETDTLKEKEEPTKAEKEAAKKAAKDEKDRARMEAKAAKLH